MSDTGGRGWLGPALLAGLSYLAVGFLSAALAGAAQSTRMRFVWRLSAVVVSAVVLGAHIIYEQLRRQSPAWPLAWHAAAGAAVGGFGLALAANLHDLASAAGYRPRMLVALVAWPLLTAAPAFLVALGAAVGLGKQRAR